MTINKITFHAVQRLYRKRKDKSTKPFNARGKKVKRCELCQMAEVNCICMLRRTSNATSAFLLIMHDAEVLKPSNTARLIADVVPETYAFQWSRTEPDPDMLALILDKRYQPIVIFPKQYADEQHLVYENELPNKLVKEKVPLFIMLDGSWREAKKMFRKSPYLRHLPMLSIAIDVPQQQLENGQYVRESNVDNQLATAQVAAYILGINGENNAQNHLIKWFDVFNFQYQKSVCQPNKGNPDAIQRYMEFIEGKRE